MAEAEFQPWGEAISYETKSFHTADLIVMWFCAGGMLTLICMAIAGWLA
jgi:hypothetical protein